MDIKSFVKENLWITAILLLVRTCSCVEEYEREYFLRPRHFNPHPYEHELSRIQDPGPVVFPRTEENEDPGVNRYNIITINTGRSKYPADDDIYSKVSEKIKNFVYGGRYVSDGEDQADNEIYDGLTHHEDTVLTHRHQELKKYGPSLPKKDYAFAYKVLDKKTGDDFSHQQVRSAKATNGEYRVKLPDGRIQIVSYKADKDGYKADVKYEEDPEAVQQKISASLVPNSEYYDVHSESVKGYSPSQQYIDYDYAAGDKEQSYQKQPLNVEIFTSNARDNNHLNYVSSILAPIPYKDTPVRYTSTPVPPTSPSHTSSINNNGVYTIDLNNYNKNIVSTTPYPVGDEYHKALAQEDELPEGIYIVGKSGKK